MFRIRRIFDDSLPFDRQEISRVQEILRERFPGLSETDVADLPRRLNDPVEYRFRSLLFVADNARGKVRGFAMVLHDRANNFVYLDFIATDPERKGSGVGGALYERVREEARSLGVLGVFFECLPDDRDECSSDEEYTHNVARLRFYERYGARPIINTNYELSPTKGQKGLPHLVFDDLGNGEALRKDAARKIVRAILENRYRPAFESAYVEEVVASIVEDPVQLRPRRYRAKVKQGSERARVALAPIVLVVNERHDIHHVRDRGYVEAPVRIRVIRKELDPSGLFREVAPRHFAESNILAVHDRGYVEYFKRVCKGLPPGKSVYPYVFPLRNHARPPKELSVRAGYYCMDTFTPLNSNALVAAVRGVDCALTAADAVLHGERLAYALVRPPGHHAERAAFGGFCYFNNNAIAANFLSSHGRVAILDIDYHHGNGQQSIFYERDDVLTLSIHGHPRFAYPYFSGFPEETGAGRGEGYNWNFPLPEKADGSRHGATLAKALAKIAQFEPKFLIVALGLDTAKGDPTGTWSLKAPDFRANGRRIGATRLRTVVIQEGGYRTRTLGANARAFFEGLVEGLEEAPAGLSNQRSKR
jgi:acetoin utilization deacetylase AcuC-like enzyme/GNAT superfamily N-acetyltransferase